MQSDLLILKKAVKKLDLSESRARSSDFVSEFENHFYNDGIGKLFSLKQLDECIEGYYEDCLMAPSPPG